MRRLLTAVLILSAALLLGSCKALFPQKVGTEQRLAAFPIDDLPLEEPVTLRWSPHLVPFIEAETDRDLAFTLGLVHAHLRGAQLALLKRVSAGRLSEMVGPLANDVDHALRILDFGYAAEDIAAALPEETRIWLQAFVDGLNHYQSRVAERPPEFGLLGLNPEPWVITDLLRIGRLAGTDVNWLAYFALLEERGTEDFEKVWARTLEAGMYGAISFSGSPGRTILSEIVGGLARNGSNTIVVGPERSSSGGALIASDPHLGLNLPNLWLLVGVQSPSYHKVGLMVPGLPFIAVGRSAEIAWGGTHMRAAGSDLYEVSELDPADIQVETVRIRNRFWFDVTREVRRTPFGPLITDAALVPNGANETLALRWVGHEVTDELTAMLRAARSDNPDSFRDAFTGFGLSPQNMLYADRRGNIGQIMALVQPERTTFPPQSLILDARDEQTHWQGFLDVHDMPYVFNPPQGFLASANNRPTDEGEAVGFLYSPDERVRRLHQLIEEATSVDFNTLAAIQQDTYSLAAAQLKSALLAEIDAVPGGVGEEAFVERLRTWDGDYRAEASGPVAFELLLYHLVPLANGADSTEGMPAVLNLWNYLVAFLIKDLAKLDDEQRHEVLRTAVANAAREASAYPTWGDMHRLQAAHLLAQAPLIGGRFVYGDYPIGGSRETPMKTAHGLVNSRHAARYGSQARHISDLSELDENYFVLFGGQDGWLGSQHFDDQIPLWLEGRYLRLPLSREGVTETYTHSMTLQPTGDVR